MNFETVKSDNQVKIIIRNLDDVQALRKAERAKARCENQGYSLVDQKNGINFAIGACWAELTYRKQ